MNPLILTLTLDPASQAFFDELRRAHFPPARNFLSAHLTLFHALPGHERAAIEAELATVAAATAPLELRVEKVVFMGRGVAYALESAPLRQLHQQLQTRWRAWLTPQDRQPRRPHVTVQNKVEPAVARALFEELSAGFVPFRAEGVGLTLWEYKGGPWEALSEWALG